jgi:phage recombination protein Bet
MKLLAEYSKTEQSALKTEICPEASDDQINYFLRVCEARGVDPFSGLLYMQRRLSKGKYKCSVQPTVDGSRAAAARTGFYAGSDEPEFDTEDAEHPNWCRVVVYRKVKGERFAFTAKCRWREFVPSAPNDFQWKAKPYHMLSKCCEVQALRKAFPECVPATGEDDYEDEIEAQPNEEQSPDQVNKAKLAIEWAKALQAFTAFNKKEADLLAHLGKVTGILMTKELLTSDHMDMLRDWYEELQREVEKQ